MTGRRLTVIAGGGDIVPAVLAAVRRRGDVLQLIDLVGRPDLDDFAPLRGRPADAVALLAAIKSFRPTHALLAGGVRLSDADRATLAFALGFSGRFAAGVGDLGLAGLGLYYCAANRIWPVGAHRVAPELLAARGMIAGPAAAPEVLALARRALRLAKRIGRTDLGQAVVLSGRRPVAAEDAAGTDALLARVGALRAMGLAGGNGFPLILAKARKPWQPRFADLPTIGPATIVHAAASGVTTIALEAGAALVLERGALAEEARSRAVSVVGL